MRLGWFRLSRWGVVALGAALTLSGIGAMWDGWDKIQIERGWSLFIAGSVAVAGGVVTLALGAVLSRLDHAILAARAAPAPVRQPEPTPAPQPDPAPPRSAPAQEAPTAPSQPPPFSAVLAAVSKKAVEVDRYVNGDTTYVMFSDGAVEVRNSRGLRRFSSLSELKAEVGEA